MLHQLLNVAYVVWAEKVQSEALEKEQDVDRALAAWEAEILEPFSPEGLPGRVGASLSRVGPGVSQFMPLPPPPAPRSA